MAPLPSSALLALNLASLALGQQGDTIWGVVSISTFGDRIPLLSPEYSAITSLGASQMSDAGSVFRDRYISPLSSNSSNFSIAGISKDQIDNSQTFAFTLDDIFLDQSAQAFMAGLYPPTGNSSATTVPAAETLSGNNTINWPNNGMQYPVISTLSDRDDYDIYLEGMNNCPMLEQAVEDFEASSSFQSVVSSKNTFYGSLNSSFSAALPQNNSLEPWNLSYSYAYEIWDYISFQSIHDAASDITADTVAQARALADESAWSIYGNSTGIQSMGGRTLIGFVFYTFLQNMYTLGEEYKITNLFTSYEPMVSLFSLLGLNAFHSNFRGMPNVASSMSFELFTNSTVQVPSPLPSGWYPHESDLFIRFLFRNGTTDVTNPPAPSLNVYSLFGNNESQDEMPFTQWGTIVESIMMLNVGNWCTTCQSTSIFCAAATNGSIGLPPNASPSSSSHQVSPVIGGVIGALVALVVAGILFLVAMLVFGIRFRRITPKKRRSELGGFKGTEKLASDPDLPSQKPGSTKNGTVIGASIVPEAEGESAHRRVESWELKEGRGKAGDNARPSFENDAEGTMKGVEAVESV